MAKMQFLTTCLRMWLIKVNYILILTSISSFLIVIPCQKAFGQYDTDSLKRKLKSSKDSERSQLYMSLFMVYRLTDFDSASYYAKQALRQSMLDGDSLMVVRAEYALGYIMRSNGSFSKSIGHFSRALRTAKNNGFTDRVKSTLNGLALAYYYDGSYDKSLEYHFESLDLRELDNDPEEIAIASNNIGLVYLQIYDYEKALVYFNRSLDIEKSIEIGGIEGTYNNLGLAYNGLGQFSKALENFERVIQICKSGCNDAYVVEAYNGAGSAYFNLGEYDKAESYYKVALDLAIENDIETKTVVIYTNWVKLLLDQGRLDEASEYLELSHELAAKINYRKWQSLNYQLSGELHSKMNDYESAYLYYRKYDSINQAILNETIARNMLKIQVDYEERQNLERIRAQDQEISRRTTLLILSVIIIFLISVILFILYRINQLRKKANQQLSEANAIIEQQNKELMDVNNVLEEKVKERTKELKDTNAALLKSNTDLDNFIYKTSHDIRGPLATLQGMCNIALMDIEEPKSVDYFEKIGRTADRLNEILSKLLVINQINNSLITSNPIDVKRLIKDILIEYQQSPGANKIRVDNQVERMDNFKSDEVLLKIILNNLISNAYKFYNSSNRVDSWIRIDASQCNNGHVEFNVIDNGIGIDETAAGKIFEIFSKASEVSDSAGLGLYLVKLAVEKLDGTIAHSKTKEGYTQFKVELPHR